jgi:hypothetical protein
MDTLDNLPTDVVFPIFGALADIDLQSLFVARRACRAFQRVVTHILDKQLKTHAVALQTFLEAHFGAVFDSVEASAESEPRLRYGYGYAPFHSLPWASDPNLRAKHIREEASWRCIPLISPSGHLVQRLQVVQQEKYRSWEDVNDFSGGDVGIWKMVTEDTGKCHFYFPEGLTLGMYYNEVIFVPEDRLCGGWKTLWETRIKDPMEFERLRLDLVNGRIELLLEEEIYALFSHDTNYLLLFYLGKGGYKRPGKNREERWYPALIGEHSSYVQSFPLPS